MHEDFSRDEAVKASSDRSFGLIIGAFFALVAFAPLVRGGAVRWWALVPAVILTALALLWAEPLAPLNQLWMRLGLLLYRVVSPLALGLLFYTTVTPVGCLMRAVGKDPLHLRRKPAASSYWVFRDPPGPSPESMKNQF